MTADPPDLSLEEVEKMLQRYVRFHSPVKLFPILESKENLWYFIGQVSRLIAAKVAKQQGEDSKRGRPDAPFLRGLNWLDKLIWDELWRYPSDLLEQRTARLCGVILRSSGLPRKPKDAHDPRRVALEYGLLLEKFESIFQRRPAKVNVRRLPQYHQATFGREAGLIPLLLASMMDERKREVWVKDRIGLTGEPLGIPWWRKTRTMELSEDEVLEFTPREAALKVLARSLEVGKEMVSKLVKDGRHLLSSEAIEALARAWKQSRHDPAACNFLQCPHSTLPSIGQDPLPT